MDQATGPLADALDRDLFNANRTLDELGWRGLWAYITTAPPGTAIHHRRTEGWNPVSDDIALEQLNEQRQLNWRYTAVHFGGKDLPFPERLSRSTLNAPPAPPATTWETVTVEELVSPEVRALLQG